MANKKPSGRKSLSSQHKPVLPGDVKTHSGGQKSPYISMPTDEELKAAANMDTVNMMDAIYQRAEKRREMQTKAQEMGEEYKKALNAVAATRDGQYFLRALIKICRVYDNQPAQNALQIVEDNGTRKVYTQAIRPYLERNNLIELEI